MTTTHFKQGQVEYVASCRAFEDGTVEIREVQLGRSTDWAPVK
jgi:hypothetical protein